MIDRFLGDAFGVLSCPFWSTILQCGARLPIHTLNYLDREVSGAQFLNGGVFECCRTSQYRRTFVTLSVSLWDDLADPLFDGVGLAGFKSRANAFLLKKATTSLLL